MIIDCREWRNLTEEQIKEVRKRVFVDGVEIKHVWYLDTEAGLVKTYNVLGDGKVYPTQVLMDVETLRRAWDADSSNWETPEDGALSKTLRGVVTLEPYE